MEHPSRSGAPEGAPVAPAPPPVAAPPRSAEPTRILALPATSWVLYDLANTVYAATITYLLTPYFTDRFAVRWPLGVTQTASMMLSGLMVPVLGAICDRTGRARSYLASATVACIAGMIGFASGGPLPVFLLFLFLANLAYQNALVFYNSLLPSVAPLKRAGLVSGLGVGIGYFGTILTLAVLLPLSSEDRLGSETTFAAAGVLFLVVALPCLFFVKERRVLARERLTWEMIRERFRELGGTLRALGRDRRFFYFLLGNFFLVDVLNTAILWFADYTREVFRAPYAAGELSLLGMSFDPARDAQLEMTGFLMVMGLVLNTLALAFGVTFGLLCDRWNPVHVMRVSGACLVVGLLGGVLFAGGNTFGYLLTLAGFGALGLAGIWTAGRKVLMLLAPREKLGEYFGLYGITMKLSVIGSTTFGLVADIADLKAALLAQLVQLALGLVLLSKVRLTNDERRGALRS